MGIGGWKLDIGAEVTKEGTTRFRVWAPKSRTVAIRIVSGKRTGTIPLQAEEFGYFSATVEGVAAGDRYFYLLESGEARPDPASRFQPDGVHEASQVVDPMLFTWHDEGWKGFPLDEYVIYELHVGTFTREGTFDAVIPRLDYLKDLGITAVQLMPVVQFPGNRNWGYDGTYPFAPQNSYGGPEGLNRLVDACHAKGLAVVMDVVYNHLGPEGNYLAEFGHYFTDRYRTPWGDAVNLDGPYSDQVRAFFIANALYWLDEYHVDALRLDAIHGIFDFSARHFLRELAEEVHRHREALGRHNYVIAESALNDPRVVAPPEIGGHGLDAQYNDDFHHALHTLLTGENRGYYQDYGRFDQMVKSFSEGFVYSGNYSPFRKRRHGSSSSDIPPGRFVVCAQDHDQVGNRMKGDRLTALLPLEKLTLAAGLVILSPYLPLLFMGEEYGEPAPFPYFTSHSDPALVEAVQEGRKAEFASFAWQGEPPDPQDEATFLGAKIDPGLREKGEHAVVFRFYIRLLELRRTLPPLRNRDRKEIEVIGFEDEKVIVVRRRSAGDEACCIFSFSDTEQEVAVPLAEGAWEKVLDSSAREWAGRGESAPQTVAAEQNGSRVRIGPFSVVVYINNPPQSPLIRGEV
ncbi:MAG: malto-oligosyltrehalose trehalohydrolase [Geobacter sp.]|nr:malto-oligosyltrehalose trehalohydrolase [Geobacter sp.]